MSSNLLGKMFAMICAVTLLIPSMNVMAMEKNISSDNKLIKKEIYEEITDPYDLIELAMQQYKDNIETSRTTVCTDTTQITASQLLEKNVYSDGTESRIYATTSFLVLDEEKRQISIEELAANATTADFSGSHTSAGGNYNLAVTCTAYWEWKKENGISYARCTRTTNQVVGNTTDQYVVTQLDCAFKASNDIANEPTYIDHVYINNPTPHVVYTATNPRSSFFEDSPYFSLIAAGVVITYNTGTTYEVYIDVKAAASGN